MCPPDDNPSGPKSPQIVPHTRSSKEGQNDTTLARLERAGPRRSGTASGRAVRLALLGGSGMLVIGLVSALVSLTRDNAETPPLLDAAVAETQVPGPASENERPVKVIDERDDRHITTVDTADPPALVRMHSDQGDRPDAPVSAGPPALPLPAARQHAPARTAKPAPVMIAKKQLAAPSVTTAARPAPLVKSAKPVVKKVRAAIPMPKTEAAVVDTDVALLSAILSQSSRHAGERAQQDAAACAEAMALSRRCADKPISQRP